LGRGERPARRTGVRLLIFYFLLFNLFCFHPLSLGERGKACLQAWGEVFDFLIFTFQFILQAWGEVLSFNVSNYEGKIKNPTIFT